MRTLLFAKPTLIVFVVVVLAVGAHAAPKTGCPNPASGFTEMSVEAAAATIWAGLIDQSPWPGGVLQFTEEVRAADRNGDGNVCMSITAGADRNPKSHWFGTDYFLVVENNAAAATER